MKLYWLMLACFSCFFCTLRAHAQIRAQTAARTIERVFPYREGYEVNIEGEKAYVKFETWNRSEIRIVIEISAKHPQRARAEQDLTAMRYLAEKVKNRIYLRNYLSVPEGAGTPESIFEVRYTIQVPADCPVYAKNNHGEITASNLANRLRINSAFTKIGLENIQGLMDVRTRFGDLDGRGLDGHLILHARRSDITLQDLRGRYDINAQYSVLRIFADQHLVNFRLVADYSEVFFYSPNPQLFAYNIQGVQSELKFPGELNFSLLEPHASAGFRQATFLPASKESYANVSITIRFGELLVEKARNIKP
jgi:hypothetical protein